MRGDSAVTYTSLDKVQLPEYAGIFSHDYFNEGKNVTTQAEIADFVKEALRDKGLGDDVTYTVDKASFDQALARTGGPSRVENSSDITVTLKQGNVSKTIKVRALYFRPSYTSWEKDLTKIETPHSKPDKKDYYKKDDHVRSSHSSHNAGKLNVADPNNYTLTEAEKNKIINDFKAVNTNLGLKDPKYSVDDKGNLTITEGDFSTVIPRDYFISNFGFVKDILVFHKEGVNEAYPLTNPIKVPVRNDKEYKDLWGANGTGIGNKGYPSKFKYAIQKDKDGNKFLVLSGTYNKSNNEPRKKDGKYEVWGKYGIGSHADKPQDYFQSFTNIFRVRVLRTKNGTIIKNLDTEKITPEELENAVGVDYKKLNALNSPDDPKGTTDAQVRAAVKARITEEFDASGLKHQIGIQNFTGRAIADKHKVSDRFNEENISNEFVATAIYYSEKIKETLVNDLANLNPNEIASIKAKIKERNKALGLSDDDIIVDQSGNISIRIKDPNSKEKDGKTTVKFTESAPLVTASYPEKTVQAGNTVTSAITPSKKDDPNYKFPEGTKFELPSGQGAKNPVGLTVDPKTGEITYKAPADAEEKDVEGTINVTLPGEDKPTPIPYLIHVQRPSYAKVRYVTSDGKDIDPKFRAEAEDKYPSEIEGKRDSRVIEYAGQKDFAAPKFVGYVFERPQVNGQNQSFNPQKNATLELVYRKLDEIIPADSGQGKPDGYVKVTFKDVEGGKLDQADADKVYFVNPKAGVKISEDGANLVGKDKDGKEQKVALPKVSPDEKYEVNYHKPSADETTTWAYDKYDQVGKEITEDKEFTAQVVKQQKEEFEPKYDDKTGTPGEEVPVEKPSFTDKDGNPTKAPEGTKYELGKDAPEGVTVKPDGSLTVKVPEGAKDGDVITVPVKVTYPDGTSDTVNAKVTVKDQSQTVEPKYKDKVGKPGEEVPVEKPAFSDKEGNPTEAPEGTKYELGKDAPQGVTVNPDGSLKVKVPEGAKDGDVITVPVKVTYPDGTSDTVNAKVTVSDQSQTVEPKYKDKVGTPGTSVKVDQPEFTGKDGKTTPAPEGTKYELGKDAPQGVTVNPDGSLTVKVPEGAKDGDVITVPVKVTYPDGTTDTVNAKVTVSDQSQTVEPKYEEKTGTPGEEVPVEKPSFTDKDGNPTKTPEGTKYELGKDAPQGVTVNPDGSITVKVPEGAKDGDVITVPVKVTYPDGTSDTVNAKVTVKDQSQTVEPKYKDKVGKPGEEVPVEKPAFSDKEGNPTEAPEGIKYELGKDAPQGITVNPDGSLTVKVPDGAKDGDVITVPVKVTYPDGTSDTVNAKVTVKDQSQTVEPKYKDKVGTPGSSVKVDQPEFTGKDGKTTPAPEGTKYELGKDAPQGATVNPDGGLTVKVPEGAKDGDVITVPVKVTYPDGTSATVNAKVTVKDQSQTVEPKYKDKVGTPGTSVKVDQLEFTGKDGNPTKAPEGTKYELGKDAPQGVTVNPDGSLTVKVPDGAKDGDVITVPVKVTYPDGTSDTVNAKVTVSDQSQTVEPKYKDKVGTPGSSVKVDQPEFTGKDGNPTKAPEGTKYELGKDAPQGVTVNPDGSLTVKVPESAKDGDVITVPVKVTYPDGTTDTVEAKITVSDQSQKYTPKPVITLVDDLNKITKEERDQAIKSLKDFNKDLPKDTVITIDKDGNAVFTYPDGTTDLIEKDKVFAERETTLPPVFNKVKEGDKEISGKTEAFAKVIVTIPGLDKPVEVTADEDGNFTVSVPDGVTLKAKDKITAIAQGKDKKVSRLGEVLVEEIPTSPLPCPSSPEPANPSPEPSQPSAPQLEDKDHPSQESDHIQQPSQPTVTDHSQQAKTDHSTETSAKEGTQTAATASPNLSRVEEKEESQTEKAAQTENANTSLPKTGVVAAPVALELLLVAAGAILALPSKRKNK
ncbi:YPDG domain-containing protein [Aerococcus sp. Group 1]|uniref:YPDG domain-containing protein n=1 Tax=Aerococcus urinae (strain CCUG 59500 / ACS-120-V-Col10a) TaxID=2976812 RepID=UPI00227BE24E|nr:YPDG domain-containing protein [Aerococcus sp. Group 1]MCY3062233.1 YPDG domain-containing protein [Aerococcus sp. Group 1]